MVITANNSRAHLRCSHIRCRWWAIKDLISSRACVCTEIAHIWEKRKKWRNCLENLPLLFCECTQAATTSARYTREREKNIVEKLKRFFSLCSPISFQRRGFMLNVEAWGGKVLCDFRAVRCVVECSRERVNRVIKNLIFFLMKSYRD